MAKISIALNSFSFSSIAKTRKTHENSKDEIKEEFQHQLTVQREDFQKQLTFIGEGFQMLSEKIDRVETRLDKRMDCLEHKIDSVSADLSAR
jgi:hypothetical protein